MIADTLQQENTVSEETGSYYQEKGTLINDQDKDARSVLSTV